MSTLPMTPNYLPMSLPAGRPRPGGGMMGKGGGRPGGAPGMGGKGGGMRPPPPMGTRPDPFRGGPIGPANPAGPPMAPPAIDFARNFQLPPQSPVLPPPTDRGFVPPLNPMMPPPEQTNVEMSNMVAGAMGSPQQNALLPQELLNTAKSQFGVAQSQPPRIIPGGGGRQFDPAPALQPGLFSMMNSMFGGGG